MSTLANTIKALIWWLLLLSNLASSHSPHIVEVKVPVSGVLQGYCIREGQKIKPGVPVAILEGANYTEVIVKAPRKHSWKVLGRPLQEGLSVQAGDCLVSLVRDVPVSHKKKQRPMKKSKLV